MNTQDRPLHIPEPGISSYGTPIQSQIVGQANMPQKVMRHQSFPQTSTNIQDSTGPERNPLKQRPPHRSSKSDTPRTGVNASLPRRGTLLTVNATPSRAATELKSVLGDHNARLKHKAALLRVGSGSAAFGQHVTLEQAKSRARIDVDIFPQSYVHVQGDDLRGHIVINARPATNKEPPIFIVEGKIRVIGFESLGEKSRSIFYQCSAMMSSIVPEFTTIYAPGRDEEGLPLVKEGNYRFPFSMCLSLAAQNGQARGNLRDIPGISLNYIAMASIKIKDGHGRRSIAHFYRNIEIWPRLDPSAILSPALRPLQVTVCKSPPKEPNGGRIKLTALLHRLYWISGQSCRIQITVENSTKRMLKNIAISLHQTATIHPHSISSRTEMDPNSRHSMVSSKRIAESILEVCHPKTKGHASAKGWWSGVGPGQKSEFEHSILIPVRDSTSTSSLISGQSSLQLDTLTVPRGKLFEVSHQVHVELSGPHVAECIQVILPIRIVGFLSVDPPISKSLGSHLKNLWSSCSRLGAEPTTNTYVYSLDQLSSPPRLIHKDSRTEAQKAEGSNETLAILESPSKGLLSDSSKVAFRPTPKVVELGNLSISGATNELVQQNARTAISKTTCTGFFNQHRLPEEYTATLCASKNEHLDDISNPDPAGSALECLMQEITTFPSDARGGEVQISIPQKTGSSRHSRFATRVQEKTRLATAAYLNGTKKDGLIREHQRNPTSLQATSPLTPETSSIPGDGNEEGPRGPMTSQKPHSHQQRRDPSISEVQNSSLRDEQPEILAESNNNTSFNDIPAELGASPGGTILQPQQTCPRNFMLGVSWKLCEHLPRVQLENPTKAKLGLQNSTPTSATPTPSRVSETLIGSVSVKDQIRRLEERVRVIALV